MVVGIWGGGGGGQIHLRLDVFEDCLMGELPSQIRPKHITLAIIVAHVTKWWLSTWQLVWTIDKETSQETQTQALHQIDGQYQERYENTRPRRPNDGRQEGVAKDGGNGRHMLVLLYKTQGENTLAITFGRMKSF